MIQQSIDTQVVIKEIETGSYITKEHQSKRNLTRFKGTDGRQDDVKTQGIILYINDTQPQAETKVENQ